jgi:excisionase family DNA binding protein
VEENFAEWITKLDAAEQLGISERTLERTIQKQRLRTAQRRIPGRKPIVVIHPSDFEKLRRETVPATPNPPSEESTDLTVRPPSRVVQEFFQSLLTTLPYPLKALSLSIKEASAYTGFSQAFLLRQVKEGKLPAIRDRGYRLLRRDLDVLWGSNGSSEYHTENHHDS